MDIIIHIFNAGIEPQRRHSVRDLKRGISEKFPNLIEFMRAIPGIPAVRN